MVVFGDEEAVEEEEGEKEEEEDHQTRIPNKYRRWHKLSKKNQRTPKP